MKVVYSSSDSYSEIAGVSMISLFENNKEEEKIKVFIIDNGISLNNRRNLQVIADKYQRELEFLDSVDIEKLAATKINVGRWHISTFYRLLLGSIIPENVDKIMYIDCDMIIQQSLHKIWNMDMEEYYVFGADDCRGKLYRSDIELPENNIYINNGFLLINLKAWRENDIESKFLDFMNLRAGNLTYMDQAVLNHVLGSMDKIGLLSLKYNAQTVFYDFNYDEVDLYRRPVWPYSRTELEESIANPTIVHFTSCFISGTRPWNVKNNHPYRDEFLRYRSMSPWKDKPLWEDDRKKLKILMTDVCNILPRGLVLVGFSVLHSKLYPLVRIFKGKMAQTRK